MREKEMAAEQENKELSMAEILTSIRRLLEENSGEKDKRWEKENDDVFEMSPMTTGHVEKPFFESIHPAATKAMPEKETTPALRTDFLYAPVPGALRENAAVEEPAAPNAGVYVGRETANALPKETNIPPATDISEEIINSFTRMFEQNDFRRRTEQPAFDADALLRQIVGQAVAEKLDNRMLQNVVRETIVPILEEWLSHYLPKLIAEEVERVMVKAGRR